MKMVDFKIQLPCTTESLISCWEEKTGRTAEPNDLKAAQVLADFANDAYLDGLDGIGGYPLDPDAEIRDWAADGVEMTESRRRTVTKLTEWQNAAYQEGRRVAERRVTA